MGTVLALPATGKAVDPPRARFNKHKRQAMRGISRILSGGALAAIAAVAAQEATAAPVQIDFTVDYEIASSTFGSPTAPFGTPPHNSTSPYPTFSGSFVFDDAGLGPNSSVLFSDYVTGLTFQTGSVTWSIADITLPPDSLLNNLIFDASGNLDKFRFELRRAGVGSVVVTSDNTMNLRTADFELSSACNNCVSFGLGDPTPGPEIPVPEAATLPLMATGLALLGLTGWLGRRRRQGLVR